uniref:hypothetical protein n=1 Tax=Peribacillus sp. FSL E2-0218 TaxID=2921364 RepID=UPI00403F2380
MNPVWVKTAAEEFKGSDVKVCTVTSFPLSASTAAIKALETENAVQNGAEDVL